MSQPWDPASEDPGTGPGSGAGPGSGGGRGPGNGFGVGADRGPSFEAPADDRAAYHGQTWRPVDPQAAPVMPQRRTGDGPDWQQTADLSRPTPFEPTTAFPVIPPPPAQPGGRSARSAARRPLIIVGIVVAVLVLLVAADRVTAVVAGARTGAQIQSSYGLDQRPDVHFGGFPFLTQLAASDFGEVDVTAHDLPIKQQNGELVIDELTASLHDVEPSADQIRVGALEGNVVVGYPGVSTLVGREVRYAGRDATGGRVRIELTGAIAATAGLTFDTASNKFQVRDVKLTAGGQSLPGGVIEPMINQLMTPVSQLPEGIQPTRVEVGSDGVRVYGTGKDLVFDR